MATRMILTDIPHDAIQLPDSVLTLWRIDRLIGAVIMIALPIIPGVVFQIVEGPPLNFVFFGLASVVFFYCVATMWLVPKWRHQNYFYRITHDEVSVQDGWFRVVRNSAPFARIQNVMTTQGPLMRRFGFFNVVISTSGGVLRIPFMQKEEAEAFTEDLMERVKRVKDELSA